VSEEVWGLEEKAHRVLQAAAVEAHGRAGAYVIGERVMGRANMADAQEFRAVAEYLESMGWITESDADYGVFVLSAEGIEEATD
jgi:hypothetical protein